MYRKLSFCCHGGITDFEITLSMIIHNVLMQRHNSLPEANK